MTSITPSKWLTSPRSAMALQSLPIPVKPRANSKIGSRQAWSALTSACRPPWPCSRSPGGTNRSTATSISRAAKGCNSTPSKKSSVHDGSAKAWGMSGKNDESRITTDEGRSKPESTNDEILLELRHSFVIRHPSSVIPFMSLLIKGGEIVTATERRIADIYCEGDTITRIDQNIEAAPGAEVIDATGKYVFPGFIDPHVHIYLPFMGTFAKDTHETASRAALVGGTTTFIEMVCPSRPER